jgi:hypothetical protein
VNLASLPWALKTERESCGNALAGAQRAVVDPVDHQLSLSEVPVAIHLHELFGEKADKVLAQYPWPKNTDQYTGAYLAGAVFTDSGFAFGIGGCPTLKLMQDLAKYAPI